MPLPSAALRTPSQRLAETLAAQGITHVKLLERMAALPRHQFVDEAFQARAYEPQSALPIGHAQTISQPAVVALMTQTLLERHPCRKVLEIGTGSGYQTAVLSGLCEIVYSVERIRALTEQARQRLAGLGCRNVHFGYADGVQGWLPYAPYDGILVTAAASQVPPALLAQLGPRGRLVIPVGPAGAQVLKVIDRTVGGFKTREIANVSFVPLLEGRA